MKKYVIFLSLITILNSSMNIYSSQDNQYKGNCCSSLLSCLFPCSCCNPDGTAFCPYEEKVKFCYYTDAKGKEQLGACQKSFSAVPCALPWNCILASYLASSNCYNGCVTSNPSENRRSLCVGQICGETCWEKTCSTSCCSSFFHDCCTCREDSWVRSICEKKYNDNKPANNNNEMR